MAATSDVGGDVPALPSAGDIGVIKPVVKKTNIPITGPEVPSSTAAKCEVESSTTTVDESPSSNKKGEEVMEAAREREPKKPKLKSSEPIPRIIIPATAIDKKGKVFTSS